MEEARKQVKNLSRLIFSATCLEEYRYKVHIIPVITGTCQIWYPSVLPNLKYPKNSPVFTATTSTRKPHKIVRSMAGTKFDFQPLWYNKSTANVRRKPYGMVICMTYSVLSKVKPGMHKR
jgi:hypothetical protein